MSSVKYASEATLLKNHFYRRRSIAVTKPTLAYLPGSSSAETTFLYRQQKQIDNFSLLKQGWDSYNAEPPNSNARYWAKESLVYIQQYHLFPCRIAPSVEGGIAISWKKDDKKANIEFFNTGEILTATRDKAGKPIVKEFTTDELRDAIKEIYQYLE